jgi:hypothetical protein
MTDPIDEFSTLDDDLEADGTDLFGLGLNIEPDPIDADLATIRSQRTALADRIAAAVVNFNPKPTAPPAWAQQGDRS